MALTVAKMTSSYPSRSYVIIDETGRQLGKPCTSWGQANKKARVLEELREEFDLVPKSGADYKVGGTD